MSDLADLVRRVPTPVSAVRAFIANTPADLDDDLYVTVLAFDGRRQRWGPCRWVPGNAIPAEGDECLLVLTEEDRTPWAITTAPVYGEGEPGPPGPVGPAGPKGDQGPAGVGVPQPVVNGQWIKGVGGAAVWSAIARADVPLPLVSISTLPTGVPDGYEVMATDNGQTPSFTWHLRYNGFSTDGMPWEFLGGSPVHLLGSQGFWTPLATGYNVYGPTLAAFRAGVYDVQWGAQFQAAGSTLIQLTITASAMSAVAHTLQGGSSLIEALNGMTGRTGVVPAGYPVGMTISADGSAGASLANTWARFWPVRLT